MGNQKSKRRGRYHQEQTQSWQLREMLDNHSIHLPPEKVQPLLYELCVQLGFCLPPKLNARLTHSPPKNPRRFAEVVMRADGVSPDDSERFERVYQLAFEVFVSEFNEDICPR